MVLAVVVDYRDSGRRRRRRRSSAMLGSQSSSRRRRKVYLHYIQTLLPLLLLLYPCTILEVVFEVVLVSVEEGHSEELEEED
eukprot:scaffold61_cov180-Ochromonas_danica.AAC.17